MPMLDGIFTRKSAGGGGTTAVANGGTGAVTPQGASANLGTWFILAQSAVAVSAPADTTEDILATISVPANAMGPNGTLRLAVHFAVTASTNIKTFRVRYSGAAGTIYAAGTTASAAVNSFTFPLSIQNRNATNSQVGGLIAYPILTVAAGPSTFTTVIATSAVDTTAATTVVVTGQKATAGETLTLERYQLELAYGA